MKLTDHLRRPTRQTIVGVLSRAETLGLEHVADRAETALLALDGAFGDRARKSACLWLLHAVKNARILHARDAFDDATVRALRLSVYREWLCRWTC